VVVYNDNIGSYDGITMRSAGAVPAAQAATSRSKEPAT